MTTELKELVAKVNKAMTYFGFPISYEEPEDCNPCYRVASCSPGGYYNIRKANALRSTLKITVNLESSWSRLLKILQGPLLCEIGRSLLIRNDGYYGNNRLENIERADLNALEWELMQQGHVPYTIKEYYNGTMLHDAYIKTLQTFIQDVLLFYQCHVEEELLTVVTEYELRRFYMFFFDSSVVQEKMRANES